MKRRKLLAAGAIFAVAGCLGGEDADGGQSSPDETETAHTEAAPTTAGPAPTTAGPAPTAEPATTASNGTSPTGRTQSTSTTGTMETTGEPIPDAPTDGENDTAIDSTARVTFEGSGSRIVVRGTIVGQDGCRTAVLESVQERESGLVVTVATERAGATGRVCSMALTAIDYRFTVRRDSQPASVTVVHRGATGERTVTTATP